MLSKRTITFRDQISGGLTDLMQDEGFACAHSQRVLSYFSGALINYKEEGVELSPTILFCNDVNAVLSGVPGAVHYRIGSIPLESEGGSRILKDCGVLTGQNWFIYVERHNGDVLNYGVAAYAPLPTAVTLREAICVSNSAEALILKKNSSNTIGVYGARGSELNLLFSTVRDVPAISPDEHVKLFSEVSSSGLNGGDGFNKFREYFSKLLSRALGASHGSILICMEGNDSVSIDVMRDMVKLHPKLDFFNVFDEYRRSSSAESIVALQSYEDLLIGFLRSDGIVIFTDCGCVVAYRAFYRPSSEVVADSKIPKVVGGARRRAYEGVASLVDSGILKAALFRSQDGLILFNGGAV